MALTKIFSVFSAAIALTLCQGCETVWSHPDKPFYILEDDRAACDRQAFEETGSYNNAREFKAAKEQCLKDKGWKKTLYPAEF